MNLTVKFSVMQEDLRHYCSSRRLGECPWPSRSPLSSPRSPDTSTFVLFITGAREDCYQVMALRQKLDKRETNGRQTARNALHTYNACNDNASLIVPGGRSLLWLRGCNFQATYYNLKSAVNPATPRMLTAADEAYKSVPTIATCVATEDIASTFGFLISTVRSSSLPSFASADTSQERIEELRVVNRLWDLNVQGTDHSSSTLTATPVWTINATGHNNLEATYVDHDRQIFVEVWPEYIVLLHWIEEVIDQRASIVFFEYNVSFYLTYLIPFSSLLKCQARVSSTTSTCFHQERLL